MNGDLIIIRAGRGECVVAAYKRVLLDGVEITVRLDGHAKSMPEAMLRCQRLVLQFLSDPERYL